MKPAKRSFIMEEGASGRPTDAGTAVGSAASTPVVGDQSGDDAAGAAAAPGHPMGPP